MSIRDLARLTFLLAFCGALGVLVGLPGGVVLAALIQGLLP